MKFIVAPAASVGGPSMRTVAVDRPGFGAWMRHNRHKACNARRRPESTLPYQIVERHYPKFLETLGASGRSLPRHVQREFEDYLKCGRLEHGFLRVRCEACNAEKLVAFS